jgi:hypothetical protein
LAWGVGVVWGAWCLWFGHAVVTDPARAPLPDADRWQYVYDWPSGYALEELAAFLRAEAARDGPIAVVRPDASGPLLEGLNLLLRDDGARVRLYQASVEPGVTTPDPPGERVFRVHDVAADERVPMDDRSRIVAIFPKPDGIRRLVVLRVATASDGPGESRAAAALTVAGALRGPAPPRSPRP